MTQKTQFVRQEKHETPMPALVPTASRLQGATVDGVKFSKDQQDVVFCVFLIGSIIGFFIGMDLMLLMK